MEESPRCSRNACVMRDLPKPAGADRRMSCPSPSFAFSQTAPQQTDLLGATDEWRQAFDNPAVEAS